jgi:hypothetical protein
MDAGVLPNIHPNLLSLRKDWPKGLRRVTKSAEQSNQLVEEEEEEDQDYDVIEDQSTADSEADVSHDLNEADEPVAPEPVAISQSNFNEGRINEPATPEHAAIVQPNFNEVIINEPATPEHAVAVHHNFNEVIINEPATPEHAAAVHHNFNQVRVDESLSQSLSKTPKRKARSISTSIENDTQMTIHLDQASGTVAEQNTMHEYLELNQTAERQELTPVYASLPIPLLYSEVVMINNTPDRSPSKYVSTQNSEAFAESPLIFNKMPKNEEGDGSHGNTSSGGNQKYNSFKSPDKELSVESASKKLRMNSFSGLSTPLASTSSKTKHHSDKTSNRKRLSLRSSEIDKYILKSKKSIEHMQQEINELVDFKSTLLSNPLTSSSSSSNSEDEVRRTSQSSPEESVHVFENKPKSNNATGQKRKFKDITNIVNR